MGGSLKLRPGAGLGLPMAPGAVTAPLAHALQALPAPAADLGRRNCLARARGSLRRGLLDRFRGLDIRPTMLTLVRGSYKPQYPPSLRGFNSLIFFDTAPYSRPGAVEFCTSSWVSQGRASFVASWTSSPLDNGV